MQRFSLTTLGCKVNQYDGSAVATILRRMGWSGAEGSGQADLVVINTCCVTTTAMRKSRQAVTKACRDSPGAAVLVVGCYGDYDHQRIGKLLASTDPPTGPVMIAGHCDDLPAKIEQFVNSLLAGQDRQSAESATTARSKSDRKRYDVSMRADRQGTIGIGIAKVIPTTGSNPLSAGCIGNTETSNPATSSPTYIKAKRPGPVKHNRALAVGLNQIDKFENRQRAFVKVQDGCDAFCTYCIVPHLRRRVWSKSIDAVHTECSRLVAAGHKEIVLCGVFLGAFGRETAIRRQWKQDQQSKLPELLTRVAGIDGLWRVRLSSLEPGDLTDELLAVCKNTPRFAPHLHLPLQSGSGAILRRMNRQYSPDDYRDAVDRLRDALDRPAITTDVIVGFPGETDDDFAATLEMARYAGFAKMHTFPFSPIEPTPAWVWRDQAPDRQIVRDRISQLADLEGELADRYRRQFVGQVVESLVDHPAGSDGLGQAITDRYQRVSFRPAGQDDLTGKVVRLAIEDVSADGLTGSMVEIR